MRKGVIAIVLISLYACTSQVQKGKDVTDQLREIYSTRPPSEWPMPFLSEEVKPDFIEIGALDSIEHPKENPYSLNKFKLGEMLFFDPRLSTSGQISCANCHDPEHGFGDGRNVSIGFNRLRGVRNTPTILNVGYAKTMFWDGRSPNLEEQAVNPIETLVEMNTEVHELSANLEAIPEYKPYFKKAFGDEKIDLERISKALAVYQRAMITNYSKFDIFMQGEKGAFTDSEVRGLHLFRTKARCINCHYSPYFSDGKFHNLGMTMYQTKYEDLGRYIITKDKTDIGKFRTPTLRETVHTDPYFHRGVARTLEEVIALYNVGMFKEVRSERQKYDSKFPVKSPLIEPLDLTEQEQEDLLHFIKTLSTEYYTYKIPKLPGSFDDWQVD